MKIKFSYILLTLSLAVAGCAAYFSVWGLSQLFAGASVSVIIMASILEFGKIVSTTALHKYWNKLAKGLRIYLTISVGVLMIITSAGIYGFLSNAYQKTANKLELHEGELGVLDGKKKVFEKTLADNQKIIDSKTKRIDQLTNIRVNQENRLDGSASNRDRTNVRGDINGANTEIQKLNEDIDILNNKNSIVSDSISKYSSKSLEVKSGSDIAGEVGPLKYIAELTGISMDSVVNYMILLLIFVFDPLAIALVLTTNKVFQIEKDEENEKNMIRVNYPAPLVVNDTVNDAVNDAVNLQENVNVEDFSVEIPELEEINEVVNEEIEPIIEEEVEPEIETHIEEEIEPIIEEVYYEPKKIIPVTKTGKIELEDIKEVKERRGYSVPIPEPRGNNSVERIGNNKFIKNGDNNRIIYKKDGNR